MSRQKVFSAVSAFIKEEDGPTAVEYAVMLALIVIACVGSVKTLASKTKGSFDDSSTAINNAIP